jgi:hypothetical protein
VNDLSNIILREMALVANHHFSLPFQAPCHASPDQPNEHLLPLFNQVTPSPTFLRAGLIKLAVFPFYHPKYLCVDLLD